MRLRDQFLAGGDGGGVAVERQNFAAAFENRARVAAGAKSAVDECLAGRDVERVKHFGEQHGNVARVAHGEAFVERKGMKT